MVMRLRFHGVRGSRPTHKQVVLGYGGNSTSMEFELNNEDFYLFLDGGSGLVNRGRELTSKPNKKHFHFLMTHTHWDHILGFPFFEPLYNKNNTFTFYASNTSRATFHQLFLGLSNHDHLPVPKNQIKAKIIFKTVEPNKSFYINDHVKVSTYQLNHQGITLGYRVEQNGASGCVITDNAPIENGNYLGENMLDLSKNNQQQFEKGFNLGMVNFLKDVNTVVFDTHFTEENLKADWGHSTPQRALNFCKAANVKRLILFHHAPEDTDDDVKQKINSVVQDAKHHSIEIRAAKEGESWVLR